MSHIDILAMILDQFIQLFRRPELANVAMRMEDTVHVCWR